MTERQIVLLNKMIEACINCGGDPGGPYWIDDSTFLIRSLEFIK